MRFLVMHKLGTVEPTTVDPVTPDLVKNMGALIGDAVKRGAMKNGAGLNPKYPRTRLTSSGATVREETGPLTGTNELLARFSMVEVTNLSEALELGRDYATARGTCTLEVGRVTEPWDIGMAPAPTTAVPEKYLFLEMADAKSEAGAQLTTDEQARLTAITARAKVLAAPEAVKPSREGKRLRFEKAKRVSIVDGPFAETKELIAGFCLLELASWNEVIEFTNRYGEILGEKSVEVDVLRLAE